MEEKKYKISHRWNAPIMRGYHPMEEVSFFVKYVEDELTLNFSVIEDILNKDDKNSWVVCPPIDLRVSLGKRWSERHSIYNKLIKYFTELDISKEEIMENRSFTRFRVDESRVKGWVEIQKKKISKALLPLTLSLPTRKTLPLIVLGYLLLYVRERNPIFLDSQWLLSSLISVIGICTIYIQWTEMVSTWSNLKLLSLSKIVSDRSYNWRSATAKAQFRFAGRRYIFTIVIGLHLMFLGVYS